jgi:ribosomal protein S18 acetylase RimI-like enzyme
MISKATLNDAATLVQLVNSAYRGENSKKGWTTEADLLDGQRTDEAAIIDLIKKPDAALLKYEAPGGALQACVYLEKQQEKLYLGMLTVAPHLQKSGLGKKLLQAAEAYSREQHCKTIIMTVISVRKELIQWYERQGYHLTGETKPFPHDDPRFGIPKQPLEFVVLKKYLYAL